MSTQFYLNPPSSFPQAEGNQGQDHLLFTFSSPSSIYFKATHELGDYDEDHQEPPQRLHKHEAGVRFSAGWSVDQNQIPSSLPAVADQNYNNRYSRPSSICKRDDLLSNPCDNGPINSPTKWMSSKMRIMRKMMNSDRTVSNKLNKDAQTSPNDHNTIRVCSDCNTTKTPLWRSGPKGPKSLCNACGIRQRKARRALAAASAAERGGVVPADTLTINEVVPKEKGSDSNCTIQYKKRCKRAGPRTKKKLQFDNFIVSLSENSSFHSMFPQDERDAAILLMALSCGLVYS